jgi:hypothetical protein
MTILFIGFFLLKICESLEGNAAGYDFARIRYPPPLLQQRSSDTDRDWFIKWLRFPGSSL